MKINPSLIAESKNPALIRKAADYMLEVAAEFHTDPRTGEIRTTHHAEDTADDLNIYEDRGWTIPEWVFHLAVDVEDHVLGKEIQWH